MTKNLTGYALRQPPSNIQAEQALLGALLANNKALLRVEEFLRPEHFVDPIHGRIYDAICRRVARGALADAVTLSQEFQDDGILAEVGGTAYLAQLLSAMVGIITAGEYGRAIRETWVLRELADAASAVVEAVFVPPEGGSAAILEQLEARLLQISEGAGDIAPTIRIGDAVGQAVAQARVAANRVSGLAGITTGYAALNRMTTGLQEGTFTVIGARPSMGKTGLGFGIALRCAASGAAARAGAKVLFWTGEMSAQQLGARAAAAYAWLPTTSVFTGRGYAMPDEADRGGARPLHDHEWEDLDRAWQAADRLGVVIDARPNISVPALRSRVRRLKRTSGLDLVIVDYLGLMRASDDARRRGRYEATTEISNGLKAMAEELHIPVIALVQLSRANESREDKRPNLGDLRDSGAIEQDADTVMFIHRPHYYLLREGRPERHGRETDEQFANRISAVEARLKSSEGVAEILVAKNRHGPTGTTRLRFVDRTTWFFDETEPDQAPAWQETLGD